MELYKINDEVHEFLAQVTEYKDEHGEFPEGAKEKFKALKLDFEEKLTACWKVIKNKEAESNALKAEIARLTGRKRSIDNEIDWLEQYAADELAGSPFKHKLGGFSWRKSESVDVIDLVAVPTTYCSFEKVPDKRMLKDDLKQGVEIPGAVLVEKNNIQVR